MKNLGKLKEYWTSYSIPRWPSFDETKELKLNNLEEISIWLTAQVNIPSEVYLWNLVKLKQFIQRIRFQKLVYDLAYLGTFFFTFLAILFFALTWIKTTLPHVTLTWVSLLAILPCFFLKQELGRRHANVEIIDLLSDQLTKTQKNKLSNLIDECLSQRKRFYFVVNGNKIRTISEECLTTQNAFLFFTGEYSHRKGIMLLGRPPLGKIYMLKTAEKQFNRNERSSKLQINYLEDAIHLQATYKKLNSIYKEKGGKDIPILNSEREARLEAITYIAKNPRFWENRNNNPPDNNYEEHFEKVREKFAKVARNHSTLEVVDKGYNLATNFIKLKDRTLENWLNELSENDLI